MSKIRTSQAFGIVASELRAAAPMRVEFLAVPRFNMTTMITMIEVMRIANYLSQAPLYQWNVVSFDGEKVSASNGFTVHARQPDEHVRRDETIFVLGSWNAVNYKNPQTLAWIRRQERGGARLCSVELGCYLVARAGLLAGRRATTHWSWVSGFEEQFSEVSVSEQLFTIDGQMMTCSGGLAGVDLMLRPVVDAHGERLAGEIQDQMLYHPIRPGTAHKRRTMGRGMETLVPVVREAITLIEKNMAEPLTVPDIAEELSASQRQLGRQFNANIGCTVVQFGLLLKLQHARVLLISTDLWYARSRPRQALTPCRISPICSGSVSGGARPIAGRPSRKRTPRRGGRVRGRSFWRRSRTGVQPSRCKSSGRRVVSRPEPLLSR